MYKDPIFNKIANIKIEGVSKYIEAIKTIIDIKKNENLTFLFRGETEGYDNYCCPNIFRKEVLQTNDFFEKSLFNAMRQNKLSNNTNYLENAIDAQHGEFPSRLLDVSYNCLTALYFAVTPYYHQNIESSDKKDGMVYIFYINDVFSPSAENTISNYNAIIDKNQKWFSNYSIFQKNHKFIDHAKINHRIVAQQGAFILFQGNDSERIPAYMVNGICIPKEAKPKIREELSIMFGINTGAIYPEISNLANDITIKSKRLVTEKFSWYNELKYVLQNLRNELSYYTEFLFSYKDKKDKAYFETVQAVETIIQSYYVGLLEFVNDFSSFDFSDQTNTLIDLICQYNSIIKDFKDTMHNIFITEITDEFFIHLEERN